MAAPTPVSAYLHSATMVKAGVYLLARVSPIYSHSEIWFYTLGIFWWLYRDMVRAAGPEANRFEADAGIQHQRRLR